VGWILLTREEAVMSPWEWLREPMEKNFSRARVH